MRAMKMIGCFLAVALIAFSVFHVFVKYESARVSSRLPVPVSFVVLRGERTTDVARHLKESHLIGNEIGFLYYLFESKQWGKFVAGQYVFSGEVSFESVTKKLSSGEVVPQSIRITFPAGFTGKQMALRLSESDLPGEEFLRLMQSPTKEILLGFPLFRDMPAKTSLEGFLFPDTYEFAREADATDIVKIFLKNFDRRFDETLRFEMGRQGKTLFETVTMASLLEAEVRSESDRKLVADLFYRRLAVGMPLQSDATVRYALGIDKAQYSGADIATDSPYNTYAYKGLPKGPIDNPGIIALRAALFPTANDFWYFLSDLETGETVFARDFEEHKQNKAAHGL